MNSNNVWVRFRHWFWNERIWCPPNITWKDYELVDGGINYAQFNDLYYSLITAAILLVLRIILEKHLFAPIGVYFGLRRTRPWKASPNEVLEQSYHQIQRISHKQIQGLAKQTDMTERQVERWLRLRIAQDKPTTLTRFTESAWRMTFYFTTFCYGCYVLSDKPWLWDSLHCFVGYPHHSVSTSEWWYYNIELGFYLSLLVSQFFDIQRKDFWQMFVHHVVTISLMVFSWACNLVRIGTLVLMIHDMADIPLEGAKICRYLRKKKLGDVVFAVFALTWIFSRLGLLPLRVIAYSSWYALDLLPMYPVYYIFNGLLCVLQVLHVIWTWLITKIALNAIFADGMKDLRESDDSGSVTDDESEVETNQKPTSSVAKGSKSFMNGDVVNHSSNGPSIRNNNEMKT